MNTTETDLFITAAAALREYIDESIAEKLKAISKRIDSLDSISAPEQRTRTMLSEGDRVALPDGRGFRVSRMPSGKLEFSFTGLIETEKAA